MQAATKAAPAFITKCPWCDTKSLLPGSLKGFKHKCRSCGGIRRLTIYMPPFDATDLVEPTEAPQEVHSNRGHTIAFMFVAGVSLFIGWMLAWAVM